MKSEEYRSILGRLPIKCPTPEDMAQLCPHLTTEQAVKAFTSGSTGYVACPPLRVYGAFQIVSYHPEWVETLWEWQRNETGKEVKVVTGSKNHPAQLSWSYAGRSRKSYVGRKKTDDTFTRYKHMREAMRFAEDNWGDELIRDDWVYSMECYIQDPTDLVNDRYHHDAPRTKAVLGVVLNRSLDGIVNDYSIPESVQIDAAVAEMSIDPHIWHELKGGRGHFTVFNCAHCGGGLLLSSCSACGNHFKNDYFRFGWDTPLTPKMVAYLQANGHEFAIDPQIARDKERKQWESFRH